MTMTIETESGPITTDRCLAQLVRLRYAAQELETILEGVTPRRFVDGEPNKQGYPWSGAIGALGDAVTELINLERHVFAAYDGDFISSNWEEEGVQERESGDGE